ncbi:helix-turn-helix transcriptional regulator [Sphingobacterium thalpophilum]|uniref:helix-turn-helix transcriptional regulator n=1 Tax=Sphingobacterium thalpophilum TaxID=259 RepID=UPI003DA535A1
MTDHFDIVFPVELLKVLDSNADPVDWSNTVLRSAGSSLRYLFLGAEVLREKLVLKKYHIELIQFNTMSPFSFQFSVNTDRLFLLFTIRGNISFLTGEGIPVITTTENSFFPSHNGPGTYRADINDRSVVKAFVISFDPQWAKKIVRLYRVLWEALREIARSDRQFSILPRLRIERMLGKELDEILDFNDPNIEIVKLKMRKKIAMVLKCYHEMLVSSGLDRIYLAGLYILKNFADPEIDIQSQLQDLPMSDKTFRRKFRVIFGTTPYDYCVRLRMEKARKLINEQGLAKKEVCSMVGYTDLGSFSRTYRSYYRNEGHR